MKNRVIKFRAWDDLSGKMIPEYVWFEQRDGYIAENVQKPVSCRITAVMQFTGLVDRKGKEIYEGDVVSWNSTRTGTLRAYRIDVVKWGGCGFLLMPWVHELEYADMEVIGNIFGNPELCLNEQSACQVWNGHDMVSPDKRDDIILHVKVDGRTVYPLHKAEPETDDAL